MRGRFDLTKKRPIKIHQLLVEGEDLFFKMEGKLGYDLNIVEGTFFCDCSGWEKISEQFLKGVFQSNSKTMRELSLKGCQSKISLPEEIHCEALEKLNIQDAQEIKEGRIPVPKTKFL